MQNIKSKKNCQSYFRELNVIDIDSSALERSNTGLTHSAIVAIVLA